MEQRVYRGAMWGFILGLLGILVGAAVPLFGIGLVLGGVFKLPLPSWATPEDGA